MLKKFLSFVLAASMLASTTAVMASGESEQSRTLTVEAESLDYVGEGTKKIFGADYVSGGSWICQLGIWDDQTIPFSYEGTMYAFEDGLYTMTITGFFNKLSASVSKMSVTINGTEYGETAFSTPVVIESLQDKDTIVGGNWATTTATVKLRKGENTIVLKPTAVNSSGAYRFCVDKLDFVKTENVKVELEGENISSLRTDLGNIAGGTSQDRGYTDNDGTASGGLWNNFSGATTMEKTFSVSLPIAGKYKITLRGTKMDGASGSWSPYSISDQNGTLNFSNPVDDYRTDETKYMWKRYLHTVETNLAEGVNNFTITVQSGYYTFNGSQYAHMSIDYIDFEYLGTEEYTIPGSIAIDEHSYTNTPSSVMTLDDNAEKSWYYDGGKALVLGGEASAYQSATFEPNLVYKTTVPADGKYTFAINLSIGTIDSTGFSPIKLTVKQGDNTLMDHQYITHETSVKEYLFNAEGWELKEVPQTAVRSYVAKKQFGDIYDYTLLTPFELTKGEVEITLTCDSRRVDSALRWAVVDNMRLTRQFDVSSAKIVGTEDIIGLGDTLSLSVKDMADIDPDGDTTITWSSTNDNILEVAADGTVTAKNFGEAAVCAVVTRGVETNTITGTTIYVVDGTREMIVKRAAINGNSVVIDYIAMQSLKANPAMFIVARFDGNTLAEVKQVSLNEAAPFVFKKKTVDMESSTGNVRVFTWDSIDEMVPVFEAITAE